jgi:hypothetical protein
MLPRAYPQVPVPFKVRVAPWVVLLVVVLGVLDDRGVIDLGGGSPAARPHHRPAHRPPAAAQGTAPTAGEVPPAYLAAYRRAARTCPHLSWALLAAVGKVESNHGRGWPPRWQRTPGIAYGTENFAGAGGPMQFLAPTWARWGRGGDRWDYRDAVPAAARKLCADGVAHGDLPAALFAYNPSGAYVARVLDVARRYRAGGGR